MSHLFDAFDLKPYHYILDDEGEPVAADLMTWALWLEQHRDRHVLEDRPRHDTRRSCGKR